jgi:hypothetical protein
MPIRLYMDKDAMAGFWSQAGQPIALSYLHPVSDGLV